MAKRAYHHGNLRAALVDAGLAALDAGGLEAFSLRDVARRAGVSAPAVYRHFSDKDELLSAIAVDCVARLQAGMDAAVAGAPPDALSRFRASGVAYVRFAVAHPAHYRALCLPGVASRAPVAAQESHAARRAAERAALAASQAAGEIAPLPLDDLLLAASAIVQGLAHQIISGQLGPVDEARATALAETVTGVLGTGLFPRVTSDAGPRRQRARTRIRKRSAASR